MAPDFDSFLFAKCCESVAVEREPAGAHAFLEFSLSVFERYAAHVAVKGAVDGGGLADRAFIHQDTSCLVFNLERLIDGDAVGAADGVIGRDRYFEYIMRKTGSGDLMVPFYGATVYKNLIVPGTINRKFIKFIKI